MNTVVAGNDHELETIGSPDATVGRGGMLNDGGEIIRDISSMLFGYIFGSQKGAITLRVKVDPNCDNDSEFTVISSKSPFVNPNIITRKITTYTDLPNFCVENRFRRNRFRNNNKGFQTLVTTG